MRKRSVKGMLVTSWLVGLQNLFPKVRKLELIGTEFKGEMMKVITVKNVWIQFDADSITAGTDKEQALQALEMINGVLQREPYGFGAQILHSHIDNSDVESEERE
jgi:hypothetical protein